MGKNVDKSNESNRAKVWSSVLEFRLEFKFGLVWRMDLIRKAQARLE